LLSICNTKKFANPISNSLDLWFAFKKINEKGNVMKSSALIIFVLFTALNCIANDIKEAKGKHLGKEMTLTEITKISDILAKPEIYIGKEVLVKGQIVDVCKKRGCWMELASDKAFETIKIKVKDGEIIFPLESRGKSALAQGKVEKIELSMEQTLKYLEHHAKEENKAFDPKSVKEALTIYRIRGTSARILD
jgi:hypothetical protein